MISVLNFASYFGAYVKNQYNLKRWNFPTDEINFI